MPQKPNQAPRSGGKRWGNIDPNDGSNSARLEDVVDVFPFPKNDWAPMRLLDSDVLPIKSHWIEIVTKKNEKISIPKLCLAFNPDTESDYDPPVACPYCEAGVGREQVVYLANAIIRSLQDNPPRRIIPPDDQEAETGFKKIKSSSWTPVRVIRVPSSLAKKIQQLAALNLWKTKTGSKVAYDVSHAKYGGDISIFMNPKESGTGMYSVNFTGKSRLTEEEEQYLKYDLSPALLQDIGLETTAQALKTLKGMHLFEGHDQDDQDTGDRDGRSRTRNQSRNQARGNNAPPPSRSSSSSRTVRVDEDDDSDYDNDGVDGDDYDSPPPPPPRKPQPPTRQPAQAANRQRPAAPATQARQAVRRPAPPPPDDQEDADDFDGYSGDSEDDYNEVF